MTELTLRQMFLEDGFYEDASHNDMLSKPDGTSVKFYTTSDGVSMFNVVDTTKPRYKWMHFRFRIDHISSWDDVLFLMQGSTVKGY